MGKQIVKVKRKRSLKISGLLGLLAFLCFTSFMFTAIATKTANAALVRDIQDTQNEIKLVRDETEALTAELQSLQNYNRVVGIAENAGLELHQDSTKTVIDEPGE